MPDAVAGVGADQGKETIGIADRNSNVKSAAKAVYFLALISNLPIDEDPEVGKTWLALAGRGFGVSGGGAKSDKLAAWVGPADSIQVEGESLVGVEEECGMIGVGVVNTAEDSGEPIWNSTADPK